MQYRQLGNTGMKVSEVGFGGEYLEGKPYAVVEQTIRAALEAGVNIIDVFMSEPQVRTNIGKAIAGRREQVIIQGHLRAIWQNDQYARTRNLAKTKAHFQDLLNRLQTDYIDIGMIHMIDTQEDYHAVVEGEIYQYALELKQKGAIRAIGLSTHFPSIAIQAVEQGLVDVLLFSLNPAYDLLQEGTAEGPAELSGDLFEQISVQGIHPLRRRLYELCATKGVGITVMKGLGAGHLLDAKRSPFGVAMTVPQCIQYALSRPAVASVLVGMQTPEQVSAALQFESATDQERDYSFILASKPSFSLQGQCVYCNHCLPCVSQIDIAQVNKYLDLAADGVSPTVQEHYSALAHPASACIQCGACEPRCPFGVSIIDRMAQAAQLFEAK